MYVHVLNTCTRTYEYVLSTRMQVCTKPTEPSQQSQNHTPAHNNSFPPNFHILHMNFQSNTLTICNKDPSYSRRKHVFVPHLLRAPRVNWPSVCSKTAKQQWQQRFDKVLRPVNLILPAGWPGQVATKAFSRVVICTTAYFKVRHRLLKVTSSMNIDLQSRRN